MELISAITEAARRELSLIHIFATARAAYHRFVPYYGYLAAVGMLFLVVSVWLLLRVTRYEGRVRKEGGGYQIELRIDVYKRQEKSKERTKARRPDLYEKYDLSGRALEYLLKDKMLHMDMIEDIRRGKADILAVREDGVLTKDRSGGAYRITAKTKDAGERLLSLTDPTGAVYVCHQKFVLSSILDRFGLKNFNEWYQVIYPKKKAPDLPEPDEAVEIRELDETYAANVEAHYHLYHDDAYIRERIASRQMIGAFLDGELAGFAGVNNDGGMGMLEVLEPFRKRGIGSLLEAEMIRRELAAGHVPYAHVFVENEISVALQKKSGMRFAPGSVFWVS